MATLRNTHGICPSEVLKFLIDLFKYNDNSRNQISDNYYRATLVQALGNTVTPVVSLLQAGYVHTCKKY
jgi:transcription initiation factor TFIID subunit 2